MLFSNLLLLITLSFTNTIIATPKPLPTSCPSTTICACGYGQIYNIYEDDPDLSVERRYPKDTFEVSQTVDEICKDSDLKTSKGIPHSRIYTLANLGGWGGFSGQSCWLGFRIPCNSTTVFHHRGHTVVAARTLITWPDQAPTWNNAVNVSPPLIQHTILGTFDNYRRGVLKVVAEDVCHDVANDIFNLYVVYSIADTVKERASLRFEFPELYEATAAGPYLNWSC